MSLFLSIRLPNGTVRTLRLLDSETTSIGRDASNSLPLAEGSLSRRHARFYLTGDYWQVEDLDSSNGTTLNGTPIKGIHRIEPGDVVFLGEVEVRVSDEPPADDLFEDLATEEPEEPSLLEGRSFPSIRIFKDAWARERQGGERSPVEPQIGDTGHKWFDKPLHLVYALLTYIHEVLAFALPIAIGFCVRFIKRRPIPVGLGTGFGILAVTALFASLFGVKGYLAKIDPAPEHLAALQSSGILGFGSRLETVALVVTIVCALTLFVSHPRIRGKWSLWFLKSAWALYVIMWFWLFHFYSRVPKILMDTFPKEIDSVGRNSIWLQGWAPWLSALIVPALVLLGLSLRRTRNYYYSESDDMPTLGDDVAKNLATGGSDRRMRSSAYWAMFIFFAVIVGPYISLNGCRNLEYNLPHGSGTPQIEVKVRKIKEKKKKKIIVNKWSPVILERMDIKNTKVMEEVEEETMHRYVAVRETKGGKLGEGGGKTGGWPNGIGNEPIAFMRLKYDGGDWDQDMKHDSGVNFLKFVREVSGGQFKIKTAEDPIRATTLNRYKRGKAPPFIYITGMEGWRMSSREAKAIREYCLKEAGMLFIDNGGGGRRFEQQVERNLRTIFGRSMKDIPNDDVIFKQPFWFQGGAPPLFAPEGNQRAKGIRINGRLVVFYHPGDIGDAWKNGHSGSPDAAAQAYQLGANVLAYAFRHANEHRGKNK